MWCRRYTIPSSLTDERAQREHAGLQVAGFYPSLHLNLADNLGRLGSFAAADEHLAAARSRLSALGDDAYGDLLRTAITGIGQAIRDRSTQARAAP